MSSYYELRNYHRADYAHGEALGYVGLKRMPLNVVVRHLFNARYAIKQIAVLESTPDFLTLTLLPDWTESTNSVEAVMEFCAQYLGVRGVTPFELRGLCEKQGKCLVLQQKI
jgi:hypothetical protein